MPRKQATPDAEADAPLLPGWKYLEHITPRRPGRATRKDGQTAKARGRKTWGITFADPNLPPDHKRVTESTGKTRQLEALEEAKRRNGEIRDLLRDIESKKVLPKYMQTARLEHNADGTRKLIQDCVDEAAAKQVGDNSARHTQDCGDHFVRYCALVGVRYMDQLTEEILLGWLRTVILEPSKTHQVAKAKWYSTVDFWTKVVKAIIRGALKHAPQLNSDILGRALPRFSKKRGQRALVQVLVKPTEEQRQFILGREWGREPRGEDGDEGGKSLSQTTLYQLYHAALRADCRQLRVLIRKEDRTLEDIAQCKLMSVDITGFLLYGLRRAGYTMLTVGRTLVNQRETMDRKIVTHSLKVVAKGGGERLVALTGYTKIGIELALAQADQRDPDEYLSEYSYVDFSGAVSILSRLPEVTWTARRKVNGRWRVIEQHGPRVQVKDLRSTGCNFAQRLHHIPQQQRAERWLHSLEVHTQSYLVLTGSALTPSQTLEEAMGCENLMRRAVRLLEIRNALGIAPRREPRKDGRVHRKRKEKKPAEASRVAASPEPRPARSQRVG